jgi:hypothetical protein
MSCWIGAASVVWIAGVGLACSGVNVEPEEPAEPAATQPGPVEGTGPGPSEDPQPGDGGRSTFVFHDAIAGELVGPEGGLPPPPTDAGLPEALVLAERCFAEGDLAQAERLYAQVAAAPDNGLAAYAQYKRAWTLFNLQEFQSALEALVQVRERLAAPATEQERSLRREAGRDLALFYAPVGRAEHAARFFERMLDPPEVLEALARLAEHFDSSGQLLEASVVRTELCRRAPERCAPGR